MKAAWVSAGEIALREVPEPEGPGVLVEIASASICGSDLKLLSSRFRGMFGHEIAGTAQDGRRVAIEPWNGCGACDQCAKGYFMRCRTGFYKTLIMGGFAQRIRVPEKSLVELPEGLAIADACLVEPMAVAVHAVNKIAPQPGQHIAIVGGGSVGLMCLAVARRYRCDVTVYARHGYQKEAAERLGASARELTEYDVVIETGGSDSAVIDALNLAAPGGSVYMMGSQSRTVAPFEMYMKELTLVASMAYCCTHHTGRETAAAARFLADRPEIARTLITHRLPLEEIAQAFRIAREKIGAPLKVVIEP